MKNHFRLAINYMILLFILFNSLILISSNEIQKNKFNSPDQLEEYLMKNANSVKQKNMQSYIYGISPGNQFDYQNTSFENKFSLACFRDCQIPIETLNSHFIGLNKGFASLYLLDGSKPLDEISPVYNIPKGNNSLCISAEDMKKIYGFVTGYSFVDSASGKGVICSYDADKDNLILKYNKDNAKRIQYQILSVHEMTHILFFSRSATSYEIQESFAKANSFRVSGSWDGNGYEDSNFPIPETPCSDNAPEVYPLVSKLCSEYNLKWSDFDKIFSEMDNQYKLTGIPVTDSCFKKIIDNVLNADTLSAFQESGITINTNENCYKNIISIPANGSLCGNANESGQGVLCNGRNPRYECPEGYNSTYINSNGGLYKNYHCVPGSKNSNLQIGALCGYAIYDKSKGFSSSYVPCNKQNPIKKCPDGYILNSNVLSANNKYSKMYSCVRNSADSKIYRGMLCGRANYNKNNGWSGSILCNGINPKSSCPKGYQRLSISYNNGIDIAIFCYLDKI